MSKHIAYLSIGAALLAGAVLPGGAAAADLYGYEGGGRPLAFHSRDDIFIDGDRARVEHSQDLRPAGLGYGYRRGPVVFDERGPDRRFEGGYGYGGPVERPAYPYGYDRPAALIPHVERPYGGEVGYGGGYGYRPVAVYRPDGPAYGDGGPDVGCTTEQAQSTTAAGWRKIVTHRICYRR